ncbi:MAG: YggS family pyridoxal phosphate-dependent enzyme [Candidatus Thioglobus sp.]|nr:MAG: YggS family pyridoxal phosphate-dependent enzyme [Candidatus Thioglobus sp.]KAA0453845.1 MAG: YggS family pyridoxal phosphate-dependent enzyme [Candidatus Thioglobus sp.]
MIAKRLKKIKARIKAAQKHSATLIAVSKNRSVSELQSAIDAGQRHFGENYLQESLAKIAALKGQDLTWHFIGPIQSNKTQKIAQNFAWVHSVDRLKIARRLNEQRGQNLAKLNILLQINIDSEPTKSGASIEEIAELVAGFKDLENVVLRGFMCIANPLNSEQNFQQMEKIFKQYPYLDTLSMGMSFDMESALENGATFVRIGTDIFGKRV